MPDCNSENRATCICHRGRLRNRQPTHPNPPSGPSWSIPTSGPFWLIPTPTEQPEPGAAVRAGAPEIDFGGSPGGPETCFTDRKIGSICFETTPWNIRGVHFERPVDTFENRAKCICHRGRDLEIVNRPIQNPLLDHPGPFRPQPSNSNIRPGRTLPPQRAAPRAGRWVMWLGKNWSLG